MLVRPSTAEGAAHALLTAQDRGNRYSSQPRSRRNIVDVVRAWLSTTLWCVPLPTRDQRPRASISHDFDKTRMPG